MEKTINVVIIHNEKFNIGIELRTIQDDLQEFYNIIHCDCIDIVVRRINGVYYNIICDDESLLHREYRPTLIQKDKQEMLCDTLIICPIDEENTEELGSLSSEGARELFNYLVKHNTYDF